MADTPLVIRKRTIEHPGFEFFETDLSIYSEYQVDTTSLAVIFASRGPIMEPVALTNMSDYTVYFGIPETEAEIYFYKGIEKIINGGAQVTAIRLPYFNATASYEDGSVNVNYKVIKGNFEVLDSSDKTIVPPDVADAYEPEKFQGASELRFQNINLTEKVINKNELINIIAGKDDSEFVIINKYHNFVTDQKSELFITVLGAGNVIRKQGLSVGDPIDDINLYIKDAFTKVPEIYVENQQDMRCFSRSADVWGSSGQIEGNNILRVDEYYPKNVLNQFPTLSTYMKDIEDEYTPAYPAYDISFSFNAEIDPETGKIIKETQLTNQIASVVYTNPQKFTINGNDIQGYADKKGNPIMVLDNYSGEYVYLTPELLATMINEYPVNIQLKDMVLVKNDDGTFTLKVYYGDSYNMILRGKYSVTPIIDGTNYTINIKRDATLPITVEDRLYVNPKKDDFITVVVSQIKKSSTESGKFDIQILEAFNGSVFKNAIDPVSQETQYIGDIINSNSAYISYYGKDATAMKEFYMPETDVFLIENQPPLRLSWVGGTQEEVEKYGAYNLDKNIQAIDEEGEIITANYSVEVLEPTLNRVKNNIKYLFRDAYDFGLTSILTQAAVEFDGETKRWVCKYNPTATNTFDSNDGSALAWQKLVRKFAQFCQFKHKLSMFHADGPRKFVLNGNLSRCDDLLDDQENVFAPKKLQKLAIKDNTYCETNLQWYEIADEFNKTKMWAPSSIFLAGNITSNDINGNVWDAPAGHRYGVITGVYRPAFNPEPEPTQDNIYLNCLNYGVSWPTGVITIEGQKTGYSEVSALNRINVRRLMIWMERWAQTVSANYIYEPNNASTRSSLVFDLMSEYNRILTLGGVQAVEVVCNEENNPPEVIDRNELRFIVKVIPTRTTEFIIGNFVIAKSGTTLSEISNVF